MTSSGVAPLDDPETIAQLAKKHPARKAEVLFDPDVDFVGAPDFVFDLRHQWHKLRRQVGVGPDGVPNELLRELDTATPKPDFALCSPKLFQRPSALRVASVTPGVLRAIKRRNFVRSPRDSPSKRRRHAFAPPPSSYLAPLASKNVLPVQRVEKPTGNQNRQV